MAVPLNQLGPFQFVELEGEVPIAAEEVEVLVRPGVKGSGLWRTGSRGRPFQLQSGRDVLDTFAARDKLAEYQTAVGAGSFSLVKNDFNYAVLGFVYVVLSVTPLSVQRISASRGGLVSGSQAWVQAVWDLLPIHAS